MAWKVQKGRPTMIKKNPTGPTYRATDLAAKYKDIGIPAVAAAAGQSRAKGNPPEHKKSHKESKRNRAAAKTRAVTAD